MSDSVWCYELKGEAGPDDDGVISIDIGHIFNSKPTLQYATCYLKVNWVSIRPLTPNRVYICVECPQVTAPDGKPYSLAAGSQPPQDFFTFFDANQPNQFSVCHKFNHKPTHLEFNLRNLITGNLYNVQWKINLSLLIPQV